ncbi:MAG: hypothetical protein PVJ49_18185 [Acidobacteriota bacterium]|jgi:hypothetical protein
MSNRRRLPAVFVVMLLASATATLVALPTSAAVPFAQAKWKDPDGKPLPFQSDERVIAFLENAEIGSSEEIAFGITNPRRVVLEQDGVRMEAALRDYEETFEEVRTSDGEFYARLRDSFIFDVPAYRLSRYLGLDAIPPVAFRQIGGRRVTLQAWLEGAMMEEDRAREGVEPPSVQRWRQQLQNMWVFDSLIGNVDRHARNFLMDEDGDLWLIDHSRSFQRGDKMPYLERVNSCGRGLFERIQALQREELAELLSPPLSSFEIDWILRRRDKLVAHIEHLIETRGDPAIVLFDDSGRRGSAH